MEGQKASGHTCALCPPFDVIKAPGRHSQQFAGGAAQPLDPRPMQRPNTKAAHPPAPCTQLLQAGLRDSPQRPQGLSSTEYGLIFSGGFCKPSFTSQRQVQALRVTKNCRHVCAQPQEGLTCSGSATGHSPVSTREPRGHLPSPKPHLSSQALEAAQPTSSTCQLAAACSS